MNDPGDTATVSSAKPEVQPQQNTDRKYRDHKKVRDLFVGIIVELALIPWMLSEFFVNIEYPRAAAVILVMAILVVLAWIVFTLVGWDLKSWFHKHKKGIWCTYILICVIAASAFWSLSNQFLKHQALAREPFVSPAKVILHDGEHGRLTRVLLVNPGNDWVYSLMLLIKPQHASVTEMDVHLSDPPTADRFEARSNATKPGFLTEADIGFDVVLPSESAKLLMVYGLAPKENRALWILGHPKSKSLATVTVVQYSHEAFSIPVTTNGAFLWPGPRKDSPFWTNFPDAQPVDISFGARINDPNPPTNNPNQVLSLPAKPISTFRLQ